MVWLIFRMFLCLLAAALIGGLIGWLLRRFIAQRDAAEIERAYRGKIETSEAELKTLRNRLSDHDSTILALKNERSASDARAKDLELEVGDLHERLSLLDSRADPNEMDELREELRQTQARLASVQAQPAPVEDSSRIAELEYELNTARAELRELAASRQRLEADMQARQRDLDRLSLTPTVDNSELERLRARITQLETELKTSQDDLGTLRQVRLDLERRLETFEAERRTWVDSGKFAALGAVGGYAAAAVSEAPAAEPVAPAEDVDLLRQDRARLERDLKWRDAQIRWRDTQIASLRSEIETSVQPRDMDGDGDIDGDDLRAQLEAAETARARLERDLKWRDAQIRWRDAQIRSLRESAVETPETGGGLGGVAAGAVGLVAGAAAVAPDSSLTAELEELRSVRARLERDIRWRDAQITAYKEEIAKQPAAPDTSEIDRLRVELDELRAERQRLESALTERDQALAAVPSSTALEQRIAQLGDNAEYDRRISGLEGELMSARSELSELRTIRANLERELETRPQASALFGGSADDGIRVEPYNVTASKTGDGRVVLTGVMPDEGTRRAFASRAGDIFGNDAVRDLTMVAQGMPDSDWPKVALVGLEQVARMQNGRMMLVDRRLTISGDVDSSDSGNALADALDRVRSRGYEADGQFSVAAGEATALPPAVRAPSNLLSAPDGDVDDLKKIWGVGPVLERVLNDIGIYHFRQIAYFDDDDIAWVASRINAFPDRIKRDRWTDQARDLHIQKYGTEP